MNKVCLHFKSDKKFNLYINGEYVDIADENKSLDVVVTSSSLSYMICPIADNNHYIIDSGIIDIDDKCIKCSSSLVDIVPYTNRHYDICYLTKSVDMLSKYSNIANWCNDKYSVVVNNQNIGVIDIYEDKVCLLKHSINTLFEQAVVRLIGSNIIIEGVLVDNKRYVMVYSKEDNRLVMEKIGESIEIDAGTIKILQANNDIASTGKVTTFDINTANETSYSVYIAKKDISINDKLIPFAFLQSIMSNNYELGKTYLDETFADVKEEQLINYFGDIKKVYYNPYCLDDKINYTVLGSEYMSYDFEVKGGKILDIIKQEQM